MTATYSPGRSRGGTARTAARTRVHQPNPPVGIEQVVPVPAEPPLLGVEGAPAGGWVLWPLGVGRDLPFEAEGQAWCTDELGLAWVRCRVLPDLGAILLR